MREYGYIRVSSSDQNTDRQRDALLGIGLKEDALFEDRQSGKDFDRPKYKRLLRRVKAGDCITILSLDRLGRNYTEILEQWRFITKEKMVNINVLDMPLLNTKNSKNGLLGVFISDLVLQILSYVAETERINIKKRQAEGIAAAKARGVKFGRRAKPLPDNHRELIASWKKGEITVSETANIMGHSKSWLYRYIKNKV